MSHIMERLATALSDRYVIERELGAGGMATVYLAHDVRHDRKVALKVLRPELSAILGGERFLTEIKTTANLQHPHILGLFDSGEADGTVFYVMPYVDGESLRDRLNREKQLPVDDAIRIAKEVADALEYAHGHGIVHRDIKPENILLHGGHAMVADFGIALAASRSDGGTRMTETGMSLGTPHYMSPEQAMGEKEITPKADIYALGCVLYEMLTAEPPFIGATAQAIIARVMTEQPRSLTLQRHTIPPHVEAVVRKALEKLPADRFASAREFAAALGNVTFAGTAATPTLATRSVGPSVRRSVAIVVPWVLLAAASAGLAWQLTRPAPAPPAPERQRVVLREIPFPPGWLGRVVAVSPDGNTIVFLDTVNGVRQLWAKERGLLAATPLAGAVATSGVVGGPTFSPDGAWIAFVADGRLRKIPRLGGSAVTIADSANAAFPAIAWLDNDTIVFNRASFALAAVGAAGGPARTLVTTDSGWGAVSASPLPGGRAVLVGFCRPGCQEVQLRAVALDGRPHRVLADEATRGWYIGNEEVVFSRQDGGVFRAPFALDSLMFTAPPTPVLDGLRAVPGRTDMVLGADGTLLYVAGAAATAGTPAEAVWVTREGAVSPIEAGWTFVPSADFGFDLAPDGRQLAVSTQSGDGADVWLKIIGGPFTRLTFGGSNIRPTYSADGRTVMYVSRHAGEPVNRVRARRADGTGTESTLVTNGRSVFEIVRLRDTTRLLLRYTTPPSRDVMVGRIGDSVLTPLLASPTFDEVMPALSPDERWLVYASNESGRYEVYVRPYPAVDAGRWQVSRAGGNEPMWSHSGRELFYRDGAGNLVSVAVGRGTTSFEGGAQRVLFPAGGFRSGGNKTHYYLTPDDRRFVFVRNVGGEEERAAATYVVQVRNWFTELRAPSRAGAR